MLAVVARSSVWETAAVGPPPDYLNAAVAIESAQLRERVQQLAVLEDRGVSGGAELEDRPAARIHARGARATRGRWRGAAAC